jgi:hypothetical protein
MKIQSRLPQKGSNLATLNFKHGESTRYRQSRGSSISIHEEAPKYTVVTGAFPPGIYGAEVLVETVRDPENPGRLAFLHWKDGRAEILHEIGYAGKILVPPDPTSSSFPDLSLPDRLLPCGEPAELVAEISSTISSFVKLLPHQLLIVAAFVVASWFPDCFEAAPYLWIVGPLGSGKTKLLMVLRCLCRRGLIVGDLRSGSIYKLIDAWNPTLLIDELEIGNSGPNNELLRMLRTGSVPGVPTVRNGNRFSTYGLKVVISRQPIGDAALASRGLVISMLPTDTETLRLDQAAIQELEKKFQPRLCMLRLKTYAAVKNHCVSPKDMRGLSPRVKQIGWALSAPLLGAAEYSSMLSKILREHDDEARIERSLEPEWLVAETLLAVCHEGIERDRLVSEILVGGVAAQINQRLKTQGEDIRLGAKKAGLVLKSLGVRTTRLGRMGRGLKLTPILKRKIHEIAAQLGIDRRAFVTLSGLEYGYGGAPCTLCKKFGLTGGLRFVDINKYRLRNHPSSDRIPLFDQKDGDEN